MSEPTHFNGYPIFNLTGLQNIKLGFDVSKLPDQTKIAKYKKLDGKVFSVDVPMILEKGFTFDALEKLFMDEAKKAEKYGQACRIAEDYVFRHLGARDCEQTRTLIPFLAEHWLKGKVVVIKREDLPQ